MSDNFEDLLKTHHTRSAVVKHLKEHALEEISKLLQHRIEKSLYLSELIRETALPDVYFDCEFNTITEKEKKGIETQAELDKLMRRVERLVFGSVCNDPNCPEHGVKSESC